MNTLLIQILNAGQAKGLTQKILAQRAGISEGALSRAKTRGSIRSDILEKLANIVEVTLKVEPAHPISTNPIPAKSFREQHRDLIWSNPNAPDDVLIRHALLKPRFTVLLEAAIEFGVDKLESEWLYLKRHAQNETAQVASITDQILKNIHDGYKQATRQH